MKKSTLFTLFFALTVSALCFSQVDSSKVIVTTTSGVERIGIILKDDGREILLLTDELGKIYIPKSSIASIVKVSDSTVKKIDGKYRATGPFTTRYYFTTNALPIKKNEDYAMINLYGPEVHFSLSDRFSLGIMTTWIASPFVAVGKYTIPTKNEKLNFGLGTMFGTSGYLNTFRGYGGLHWGMITYGDRHSNITISGGFAYVQAGMDNQISKAGIYIGSYYDIPRIDEPKHLDYAPILSIAGTAEVGEKARFIFDSMVLFATNNSTGEVYADGPNNTIIVTNPTTAKQSTVMVLMPGMRFQQTEKQAFQFALAGVTIFRDERALAFPAPMCSWLFKF